VITDNTDDCRHAVRLRETARSFESTEYPTTREQACAEHGDLAVELADGEATVTTVLERAGDETYESHAALPAALFCGLPAGAVERFGYSDRDAPALGEGGPTPVSS
jgi:hypothetical protein